MGIARCLALVLSVTLLLAGSVRSYADDGPALQETITELKRVIAEQQKAIAELSARLAALEGDKSDTPGLEDIPPIELPDQTEPSETRAAPSSFMPDFAVIGNHVGAFLVPRGYDSRNRFHLAEVELALQQPIYTGMDFYATIAGGAHAGFTMGVEEAYVTLSRPFKLPFDGVVGKRRIQFGKLNALHPHAWRHVDQPAPIAAFLGEEGLFGNGASLSYTLPVQGLFANLEIGLWGSASAHAHVHEETEEDTHHGEPGAGISGDMPVGRLWLSKALGDASEIELGTSHAFGKADHGDPIQVSGLDLTYRAFPTTYSRLQLQAELFWHRRKDLAEGSGTHTRSGHYALLTYAPDKYYEYGIRFDNTRYPWPLDERDQSLSLILTNRLSEQTLVRLQCKVGDRSGDIYLPARKGYSEVFLQFIWGAGSHKHPLQ